MYRYTTPGEAYTKINAFIVTSSDYGDSGLTNDLTYYYVVRAVDTSANESGKSNEVSEMPQGGGSTTMHVLSIVLTTLDQGGGFKKAQATVTIVDNSNSSVPGARVTGNFIGDINEEDEKEVAATTNDSGQADFTTTNPVHGRLKFNFCVDDVALVGYTYDSSTDVETCP